MLAEIFFPHVTWNSKDLSQFINALVIHGMLFGQHSGNPLYSMKQVQAYLCIGSKNVLQLVSPMATIVYNHFLDNTALGFETIH